MEKFIADKTKSSRNLKLSKRESSYRNSKRELVPTGETEKTLIPCPSSLKNLLSDSEFYEKLNLRLKEEKLDVYSTSRMAQDVKGLKYIANGSYGVGASAYRPDRNDSQNRKRN